MSSPLLVKSFGFASLSCDLEGASFPRVPRSRRSYCFKHVWLFMVAGENSGVLLRLWSHLNGAPEDSACPFSCDWGNKNYCGPMMTLGALERVLSRCALSPLDIGE